MEGLFDASWGFHLASLGLLKAEVPRLGEDGGDEVDEEGEDVEGEDEGYDPFEDGAHVFVVLVVAGAEGDGEGDFDDDESKFNPKGCAQDAVFAIFFRRREGVSVSIKMTMQSFVVASWGSCISGGKPDQRRRGEQEREHMVGTY